MCNSPHPVCYLVGNKCLIKCGAGKYRQGGFCYDCASIDSETLCQKCGDNGVCSECKAGYTLNIYSECEKDI